MQHINSLPCLVIRLIFSKLPLYDLLQAGRVCALWKEHQMDITCKISSVTLLIGKEPQDLIAQSSFTLHHSSELLNPQGGPLFSPPQASPTLTADYLYLSDMNQLVASLPNLTTLNMAIHEINCCVIEPVIYLLNRLKRKLVIFKLWGYLRENQRNPMRSLLPRLFRSINLVTSLEHVTLDLANHSQFYTIEDDCDFSFLSRIREFNYTFRKSYEQVPQWLTQHGSNNTRLQRIGLSGQNWSMVPKFVSTCFAGKMTVLPPLSNYNIIDQPFSRLNAFASLVSLKINFQIDGISFADVIKSISSLKHLIRLNIALPASNYGTYEDSTLTEFNRISTNALVQLPSVKLLSLNATFRFDHTGLESPHWGWIFPNVQILSVKHDCNKIAHDFKTIMCSHFDEFASSEPGTGPSDVMNKAIRVLLSTFKQCPSLRRIYLNDHLPKDPSYVKFNFDL